MNDGTGALLILIASCSCAGSSGRAQPAEVEISWPDAASLNSFPSDAGLENAFEAPVSDAAPSAEASPLVEDAG